MGIMPSLLNLLSYVRMQGVCYVTLCMVIFYLFRAKDSYHLSPVWRRRTEFQVFNNGMFPDHDEGVPSPIVTDLEYDGVKEVVMVSSDGKLSILALPHWHTLDGSLPHIVIKHEVDLPLKRLHGGTARPVVLETGFHTPYLSTMENRTQIIVVVTSDWHVACFDHKLKLMWDVQLPTDVNLLDNSYSVKSLGALITFHSVQKHDSGLIVVGGSFIHSIHQTKELLVEKPVGDFDMLNETKAVVEVWENFTHFSTFGLSARNGTIRWRHLPGEFGQLLHIKDLYSEHHWKLGLRKNRKHCNDAPWKNYRMELFERLPHVWSSNHDTRFSLGSFSNAQENSVEGRDVDLAKLNPKLPVLSPHHIVGFGHSNRQLPSQSDSTSKANAVVISYPNGIKVLSLLSGQPITRLEFPATNDIHFDIDGDGEVEKLMWDFGKGHTPCFLDIWHVQPVKEKLEHLSLCTTQRLIWQYSWAMEEDVFIKVPPVLFSSIARKGGLIRHFLGNHLVPDDSYDLICMGAVGRMSSFDLFGNAHWQTHIPTKWSDLSIKLRRKSIHEVDQTVEDEFMHSFSPGFVIMPLMANGRKNVAAAVGWNALALVDLVDGKVLAEHSIPAVPTQPLVYGDFDNDGVNDIILVCKKGFIGFTLKQRANYLYSFLSASTVLLSILLITWLLSQPAENGEQKEK